ncbi:MAG: MacB family efflux pump subunit [Dongiaceae bacterium]
MSAAPLLALKNIVRSFTSGDSEIRAVDNVSLEIFPGEFIAIMGQSGSGKTTLMNILGCLDKPTSGSYKIWGREVSALSPDELAEVRREIFGFIFQRYNLLHTANAIENVEIPAIYAGLAKSERIGKAKALLQRLGLGERSTHRPSQLSGGQQQRVAIARALVNDPAVILADEPTGALDSKSGREVMELLHQLHQEGRTIILITHDERIAQNAKRIIRIVDGRIVEDNPPPRPIESKAPASRKARSAGIGAEIAESTKIALRALRVNLFRTSLTLLGIVIGVAAVVTLLAVGDGSKQKILDQISSMGTNLMVIRPGGPGMRSTGDIVTLAPEDVELIQELPNVEFAMAERSGSFTVRYGNVDYSTLVQAVGTALPAIREWNLARGHFFTERDLRSYAPVAVVGQTVVKNLWPNGENPIGDYIIIRNVPFEVIGVMETKGANPMGQDQDDAVFVPITTGLIRLFGRSYVNGITVKVADVKTIEQTQSAIYDLIREKHRTENFRIRNMASILETASEAQNTLTILLGAVAAISLLVGGIGVMNIMLVNVTERTKEIGIRMATGARRRDILLQFNTEAAVVCIVGGLVGVVLGFLVGFGLSILDVAVKFSAGPAILAFSCAFATGLLFGYLPARTASRLDPVVALATE